MKVLIQFEESYQDTLEDLGQFFTYGDGVLDVIVDNSSNKSESELCSHYNFDYDYVDCIKAL